MYGWLPPVNLHEAQHELRTERSCFVRLWNTKLGRLLCGTFFFRLQNRLFFFPSISFCPVKRGNRAGSSREWVSLLSERYPDQLSVSRLSQLREFRTSSFSNFFLLIGKKKLSNRVPFFINCQFSHYTIEKWVGPKFSQLRLSRSGKLIWVPLRE